MSIKVKDFSEKLDNVTVFQNTRDMSRTKFYDDTIRLETETKVYSEPAREISLEGVLSYEASAIRFTYGGTVSTAYKYADAGYKVAMLNFANPLVPGGGVLSGSTAQEENICRCTNLYESITTPVALARYYRKNEVMLKLQPQYTHALIYSPNIVIFKDDVDYHEIEPRYADVITCPSPSGGDTEAMSDLIKQRIDGIIKSAIIHDVEVLILGAWGCGVFAQKPAVMARLFGEVITDYAKYFEIIDFAIRNNDGSQNSLTKTFEKNFLKGYKGYVTE